MTRCCRRALTLCATVVLSACGTRAPPTPLPAPDGQWINLLSEPDLRNWTVKIAGHDVGDNFGNTFRMEHGVLAVSYQDYDQFANQFGSLFYKQKFSHYWLRAEYRFTGTQAKGAPSWAYQNSGLQLHSQAPDTMRKEQQFPVSVEFDIVGGRAFGSHPTGDVCENGTRVKISGVVLKQKCSTLSSVSIKGDEWVSVLAEVQGSTRVRQAVNGGIVVDYTDLTLDEHDADARRLLAAGAPTNLSAGYLSIQANSHPIEFRRIEVLPLD